MTFDRADLVSGFLRSRRARLAPDPRAPVFDASTSRRVPGMRREELAWRAGLSADYYTKLEQGRATNPSEVVLTALSVALRLDPLEQRYLRALFADADRLEPDPGIRQRAIEDLLAIGASLDTAAMLHILDRTLQLRALDERTRGLMFPGQDDAPTDISLVEYTFLYPEARRFYIDWSDKAAEVTGMLQLALADDANRDALVPVAQRVWAESPAFRTLWRRFDVHDKGSGQRRIGLPDGRTRLYRYVTVAAPRDPSTRLVAYLPLPET